MKLYVSGPMRGHAGLNFGAFDDASASLRHMGHEVVSPAEHARESVGESLLEAQRWDLEQLLHCDGIVMLGGWRASVGARAELGVALWCGLGTYMWCGGHLLPLVERESSDAWLGLPESIERSALYGLHYELCCEARELLLAKNADYTGGATDAYANLRASVVLGVQPGIGILVRLLDKLKRLESYVRRGRLEVSDEGLLDTCYDVVNYVVLLVGLLTEEAKSDVGDGRAARAADCS